MQKAPTTRVARACATVRIGPAAFELVKRNEMQKGDVLSVAQLAGVMGVKQTSTLIPLCHNLLISRAHVELALNEAECSVRIQSEVKTVGQTGVEMEALTGATIAALTVYDMCKAVAKDAVISDVFLLHKSGGKSGEFNRSAP